MDDIAIASMFNKPVEKTGSTSAASTLASLIGTWVNLNAATAAETSVGGGSAATTIAAEMDHCAPNWRRKTVPGDHFSIFSLCARSDDTILAS